MSGLVPGFAGQYFVGFVKGIAGLDYPKAISVLHFQMEKLPQHLQKHPESGLPVSLLCRRA